MVRSMWLPVTSGVVSLCVGIALWPQLASTADGLSVSAVLFGASADAPLIQNPLDALFQRLPLVGRHGASLWSSPTEQALPDLRVGNLSVHRIRYERGASATDHSTEPNLADSTTKTADKHDNDDDETLIGSVFGSAWAAAARKARTQPLSSVVVTWEDHHWAADARPRDQTLCPVAEDNQAATAETTSECRDANAQSEPTRHAHDVQYQVQLWVNGWGLDALWHPVNRKILTRDPFVVLHELPQDQELCFRVRIKVTTTTGLLSGWFATEIEGPWSDVVTLSPSKEHAFEVIVAFFLANKFFGAVLVSCIGLSVLVILRLVYASVVYGQRYRSAHASALLVTGSSSLASDSSLPEPHRHRRRAHTTGGLNDRVVELEQEVADLRQELADSEAEVRRLMLFRGYGIDDLSEKELDDLEMELRHSIKLVQKRRRGLFQGSTAFESLEETEEEEDDDVEGDETRAMPALSRNGMLGTVFEDNR